MRPRGVLNAFWLKIIMLVLMAGDHLYMYIFKSELLFVHYLARVVAPVFVYLMAQGMLYTHDRARYIFRLFSFGAVMAAGNLLLQYLTGSRIPNNILLSLGIGAAMIYFIDKFREGRPLMAVPVAALAAVMPFCEGAYIVPVTALIYYYLRDNPILMHCVYTVVFGLPYLIEYVLSGRLDPQFYMIFAVIPIMLYNGGRGPDNAFAKYFFYVFYPLHVWVIFIISKLI